MNKPQTLFGRPVVEVDDMPDDDVVVGHVIDLVPLKIEAKPGSESGDPITFIARIPEGEETI